ncbi:Lipase [Heracleum sosnowskyi]|uniref:Lipase n=1 Tax=Heracleum sosnowskyi TaxID=360622 RepID=A0AAD8M4N8_9APIA|nr:Lipase [Heracleum sosnowskyi]
MDVHGLLSVVAAIVVLVHSRRAASASLRFGFGLQSVDQGGSAEAGLCSSPTNGYKCQGYDVVTGDGYILSMSRISQGRNGEGAGSNKQPVLLQHGIFVDGMSWMQSSANQSLAFILVDNGYDVWISNTRGTRFSRRHRLFDPVDKEFWEWTWDDLATNEVSATTDFVFNQTGQKVHYVGHSLGTLTALAAFSEGNQVINKVKSATLLSPIAYLSHMTTALGNLVAQAFTGEITDLLGMAEYNPVGVPQANFLKPLCINPMVDCNDMITEITGQNCCLQTSTGDLSLKNNPQSTSTKNLVHLAQIVRYGKLAKFDYEDPKSNMEHYGQPTPPIYNMSNIPTNLPLFLSYGGKDKLSDVEDVQILLDCLKSHDVDKLEIQFVKEFAHIDFVMGVNANNIVYNRIMTFFKKHQ